MRNDFLSAYFEAFKSIDGAFQFDAALMFMAYNQLIDSQNISGDVLEVGVHHGLSSIAVASLRAQGRRFVAIDLFEDLQSQNASRSGSGDKASFISNMERFYEDIHFLHLIQSNSVDVEASDLGREFSFCHIDGGHSDDETYRDLQLCHQILLPGGLLAVDDYFNPSYPGVSEGTFRFMLDNPEGLNPIAIGFNKVLFQKPAPTPSLNALFANVFSYIPKVSATLYRIPVNLFWSKFLYFFDLSLSAPGRLVRSAGDNLRATYESRETSLVMQPGEAINLPILVTNNSTIPFQCGDHTFGLSYHLLSSDGVMLQQDNSRNFFTDQLDPGEQRTVELSIRAPEKAGDYIIEIDIVWEGVTWFKDRGNQTCLIPLIVP